MVGVGGKMKGFSRYNKLLMFGRLVFAVSVVIRQQLE